jgi:hypothetical protein
MGRRFERCVRSCKSLSSDKRKKRFPSGLLRKGSGLRTRLFCLIVNGVVLVTQFDLA